MIQTGNITAVGVVGPSIRVTGAFNFAVTGAFDAAAVLERSYDGGTTYTPVQYPDGTAWAITQPVSARFHEYAAVALYRVRCTSYTAGEMVWRLSQ